MRALFLFIFVFFLQVISGQERVFLQWNKAYGGFDDDNARCVQQTSDGGYIIAGTIYNYINGGDGDISEVYGNTDIWIVKISVNNSIEWSRSLGGSDEDEAYSIKQTLEGGFIVAGTSRSKDGDVGYNKAGNDFWIVKLDVTGAFSWEKSYGGYATDVAKDIALTSDGGYVAVGYTTSNDGDVHGKHAYTDSWVIRLNADGDTLWTKCLGGNNYDLSYSVEIAPDNSIVVAGKTNSTDGDIYGLHGEDDFWVVKLSPNGEKIWSKCYGGSNKEYPYSIKNTLDGGFIVAGQTGSENGDVRNNHGLWDFWVIKIDTDGKLVWSKTLGGANHDDGAVVSPVSDGGFIIAGRTYSNDGDVHDPQGSGDIFAVKLDSKGEKVWTQCFGGTNQESASYVRETNDGGYIIAGSTNSVDGDVTGHHFDGGDSDFWIVKLAEPSYSSITLCEGEAIYTGRSLQTSPGIYTDTLETSAGLDSLVITELFVQPLPSVYLGNDTTFYLGSVILDAGSGFESYKWNNGSEEQSIEVANSGMFYVEVSDKNNCSNTDTIEIEYVSDPEEIILISMNHQDVTACSERNSGTIVISALGGTGELAYSIDNGQNYYTKTSEFTGLMPGSYFIKIRDEEDVVKDAGEVIIKDLSPKIEIFPISGPEEFDLSEQVSNYHTYGPANSTYFWKIDKGEIQGGQGFRTVLVDWTVPGKGKLSVVAMDESGCVSDTMEMEILITGTTGLNEAGFGYNIAVYPNPSKGIFHISKDEGSFYDTEINVFNVMGAKVFNKLYSNEGSHIQLDLSMLQDGIYWLQLTGNKTNSVVFKIIKE
ncbi:MAG: T9SS type A sorting domain-containing protein [Bacteroidales bacterium]|nr:T9SS type A sorting domain-containing protein [Bacteroidales bacterium]